MHDPKREYYHGELTARDYAPPRLDLPTIEVSTNGEYIPPIVDLMRQIQAVLGG